MATQADQFVKRNNMESRYCFLINMAEPSNAKRFIVYDLINDSVIARDRVTHGRCGKLWLVGRKYSNEIGCGCTSLGKYKIGRSYQGKFGLAYKLHGLDSSNSNAFKRYVVLHSHDCVPEASERILQLCQSDGCPTVSPSFLLQLDKLLQNARKPVLLWINDIDIE